MTDTPENNPISNDKIDPDHSKPLDVHRWSEHPEINKLVDELWLQVVEPALGGKSNNKGKSNPKRQLKVLLIDLYVAWLDDPTLCIGVNRNSNAYIVDTRYNAIHISRKIVSLIDVLVEANYLDYLHGSHDRTHNGKFSRTSRVRSSLQLQDKFSGLVLSPLDIEHNYLQETVILTDYETDAEGTYTKSNGKKKRQFIEYDDTDFTNDSPTVEVDYKGLHAAILSAKKGIVYGDDRYDLGSVVCPRLDKQQQRRAVKLLVLAAINAKDHSSAFGAFRYNHPDDSIEKTLTNDELGLLLGTFLQQHPYLEDGICSDQGIRLMNVDSHITNYIIKEFVRRQKPILSIHDSYIVDTKDVELLRDCMKDASLHVVGVDLAAEQELPSYQDVMATRYPDRDYHLQLLDHYLTKSAKNKTTGYKLRYQRYKT